MSPLRLLWIPAGVYTDPKLRRRGMCGNDNIIGRPPHLYFVVLSRGGERRRDGIAALRQAQGRLLVSLARNDREEERPLTTVRLGRTGLSLQGRDEKTASPHHQMLRRPTASSSMDKGLAAASSLCQA
jgi:hypothetical protein